MNNHLIIKSFLIFFLITSALSAQQMKVFKGGEITFVAEIKGVVEFTDNQLKITSLNNQNNSSNTIDVKLNDEILYLNGKRVKSLESFQEAYDKCEIGSEVKLGIKRNEEMLIASFPKQDPSKSPHKVMRFEAPADGGEAQKVEMKNGKIIMNGKEIDIDSLKNEGVIIKTKTDDK